ncbi:hypothetical protein COXBURSA331_A1907 [Coxiella burnetii RSA 331]|nr:hypothetical protein COXBURSA331_A1907 [Coxiella burnetii RSA 331]
MHSESKKPRLCGVFCSPYAAKRNTGK